MIIASKDRTTLVNMDSVTAVYIGESNEIKAIIGNMDKMYRLGRYKTMEDAKNAFDILLGKLGAYALIDDDTCERINRIKLDNHPDKFAGNGKKAVRRGKS